MIKLVKMSGVWYATRICGEYATDFDDGQFYEFKTFSDEESPIIICKELSAEFLEDSFGIDRSEVEAVGIDWVD